MQGYTCEMPTAAEVTAFYRRLDECNTPSVPLEQRQPIADLKPQQEFFGNRQERRKQAKAWRSANKGKK